MGRYIPCLTIRLSTFSHSYELIFHVVLQGFQGKIVSQVWQTIRSLHVSLKMANSQVLTMEKIIGTKSGKKLNIVYSITECLYTLEHHQASVKIAFCASVLGFSHLSKKLASSKPNLPSTYRRTQKCFSPLIILVIKK